jgi:hypothetical protein
MSTLSDLANRVRSLPLDQILRSYGFELQREGNSQRARTDRHNIVFQGEKWFDNSLGIGGGGAIDLVKHLTGASFASAVNSLAHKFSAYRNSFPDPFTRPSQQSVCSEKQESFESLMDRLGKRDDSQWEIVRRYLIEKRSLDPQLIDQLHDEGKIYANDHRPDPSVVFLHTDPIGNVKGATLRDTKHQSSFRPSLGDKKDAWFMVGNLSQAQSIVITEAPIDALSYCCLNKSRHSIAAISVSGAHVSDELLRYAQTHEKRVILAFDNDRAGELAAERLMGSYGKFCCQRPNLKDWNEDLCFLKQSQGLLRNHQNIPRMGL